MYIYIYMLILKYSLQNKHNRIKTKINIGTCIQTKTLILKTRQTKSNGGQVKYELLHRQTYTSMAANGLFSCLWIIHRDTAAFSISGSCLMAASRQALA